MRVLVISTMPRGHQRIHTLEIPKMTKAREFKYLVKIQLGIGSQTKFRLIRVSTNSEFEESTANFKDLGIQPGEKFQVEKIPRTEKKGPPAKKTEKPKPKRGGGRKRNAGRKKRANGSGAA